MFKLEEFKQLVRDFSDVADFLVIYVAEAHSAGQSQLLLQPTPPGGCETSGLFTRVNSASADSEDL